MSSNESKNYGSHHNKREYEFSYKTYLPYSFCLIPFMFGMMIALSSNSEVIRTSFGSLYENRLGNTSGEYMWILAMSLFPFGGLFGTLSTTFLLKMVKSRKLMLICIQILGFAGSILYGVTYFIRSFFVFALTRFIYGCVSGVCMNIGLISYLEMVVPHNSQMASTFVQPLINLGIVCSSFMNQNNIIHGHWIISLIPVFIFQVITFVFSIILPESPSFILQNDMASIKAMKNLMRIRAEDWDFTGEIEEIKEEIENNESLEKIGLMKFLKTKELRLSIIVVSMICGGQQLSGINALVFYASNFVNSVGFKYVDIGVTFLMLWGFVGSVIFAYLVPKFSNKIMMVHGHLMMAVFFIIASFLSINSIYPLVGLIFLSFYLFFFQSGPGSLPWVIYKTTFESKYHDAAQGLLTAINWSANLFITAFSLPLLNALKIDILIFFGMLNLVFAVFFELWMEEKPKKQ